MRKSSREFLESFEHLSEAEKRGVASEIMHRAFPRPHLDDARLADLYGEFGEADRRLADEGIEG
jgi:hypothetical protein